MSVGKHLDDLRRLHDQAAAMPARFAQARLLVSNLKAELETSTEAVKDREADTLSLVSAEVTVAGNVTKSAFPNKEAREAEVRKRLAGEARYQELVREVAAVQRRKSDADIELNRVQDEDRMLDRSLDAVAAALRAESAQLLREAVIDLVATEASRSARDKM